MRRLAINGYGRIGRSVLRALYESPLRDQLQVVAVNELADAGTVLHLTRYDSTHGRFPLPLEGDGERLVVDGDNIALLRHQDIGSLPWGELGVDMVLECTGAFSDRATAEQHLRQGASRVLFSQPARADVDATVVLASITSS
jgi:glyceraldehyde-3-phosphate dehydrogenase/erythrose-4-phosphate dehydrogenase